MKKQLILVLAFGTVLAFAGCAKKAEDTTVNAASTAATSTDAKTTPEQQAQINALDKPVLDDKNATPTASEPKAQ
ncbi:hypothetical protein [Acinetobacter sp. MD2]|uniref:hypothetical protein n=1 Tax=Acinetobacter sp. MD2 TaxID=2600066 RepID=UPI002D1E81E7|nr:hypothetical protein [Acinetobacter sp. MD2]MEB3766715.1 hypothetical protein [Acinetobacter sp. MD2]